MSKTLELMSNLNIVYDTASTTETFDQLKKQIEDNLKNNITMLVGSGGLTGYLPVLVDEWGVQVTLGEPNDNGAMHCNVGLTANFQMDTDDETGSDVTTEAIKLLKLEASNYLEPLKQNIEALFEDMAGHGLMTNFNDDLLVDVWKVAIDTQPKQAAPSLPVRSEPQL